MVRLSFAKAARRVLVAAMLATLGAGICSASAGALTREVGCAQLQSTIDEVAQEAKSGEGDVIVLNGLCDTSNLGSASGVTLPGGSDFSIEGKPGTSSGFDGAGVGGPLLGTVGSEEAGAMTLSHLIFQHANLTGTSALSIRASRVTLSDDRFLENEEHGENAHAAFVYVGQSQASCPSTGDPPAIALTDSTFSSNRLALGSGQGGGTGALLQDTCELSQNVLEGNTFEGNTLEAAGTAEGVQVSGAGLRFAGASTRPVSVSQSANIFDSNGILAVAPDIGNYGGGGEWLEGVSLRSVGDRFSRNTIAGTSSSSYERWSWGAGLAISNLAFACSETELPESTLEDAVVTGNAIGSGTEADLGGGGIWVGCTHLRVLDSTVTLNRAPYGAGIEGEPGDQLELADSIVAGDSGGNEIAGFEGEASASLSAGFSDVCAAAGSSVALSGAGNICANPLLADDGNPASSNVRETASSPTIDSGSNALLPADLSTDFYGTPRVLSGGYHIPACTPPASVVAFMNPPTVDMGASEFGPVVAPTITIPCPAPAGPDSQTPASPGTLTPGQSSIQGPPRTRSSVSFPSLTQRPNGLLILAFTRVTAGELHVQGTFKLPSSVVEIPKGRRTRISKLETLPYGQATRAVSSPGSVRIRLEPTKRARVALARRKHLRVRLAITFTALGAAPLTREQTITVVYRAPRR